MTRPVGSRALCGAPRGARLAGLAWRARLCRDANSVSDAIRLELSPNAVDAIAQRAAEIVLERFDADRDSSPWLSGAAAAGEYLGWPRERVYKRVHELPHHRHGNRLMFRREDLDDWVESHRERGR